MSNYIRMPNHEEAVRLFLDQPLLATVDEAVFKQAGNTARTPGVEHVCVLPDCHSGYGAPIGSVVVSQQRVIPGPVGYDIGCGLAVYLTNVLASTLRDRGLRRRVMDAIDRGIAMGEGKSALHDVELNRTMLEAVVNRGAVALQERGLIPADWVGRCERATHEMPGGEWFSLEDVPERAQRGFGQLGTLGGGKRVAA